MAQVNPRVWLAPLLTLALGGFTALGVAFASFDVLWDAAEVQESAFVSRLQLVADLSVEPARTLLLPPPPPAPPEPPARGARVAEEPPPAANTAFTTEDLARGKLAELARRGDVGEILVADRDGGIVHQTGGLDPAVLKSTVQACGALSLLGAGRTSTGIFESAGKPWRASCSVVTGEQGDELGLAAAVAEPLYLSDQAARSTRTRGVVVGLGALVGLGVIFGVRAMLAPFREVAQAAQRMASGERGVRVNTSAEPEIAQVASALNELASAVEAREDEIRSRLASVAQLSSMVAHEVRNPLQSLSLLATLARTEKDPEERDSLLTSIESEIHVLEGVVQRFLRSSGPLQISRAQSDLVEVVNKALGVATPQARTRQVALEIQAPPRLPMTIDASLVRRAMENLLLNAIEFSGQEPPGVVRVEIARRLREAVITIDDNGPGVPPAERDRVFKAYYSSKAGGTGLGLALVKQVFQAHGGTIRCEDSPLGGARFTATLPIEDSMEVPFAR